MTAAEDLDTFARRAAADLLDDAARDLAGATACVASAIASGEDVDADTFDAVVTALDGYCVAVERVGLGFGAPVSPRSSVADGLAVEDLATVARVDEADLAAIREVRGRPADMDPSDAAAHLRTLADRLDERESREQ